MHWSLQQSWPCNSALASVKPAVPVASAVVPRQAAGAFRDLLAAPLEEARALLQGRIPVPKLLECDQGGSQVSVLCKSLFADFMQPSAQ